MVSLRHFLLFPKEVDYSQICVSTMHHLEHCQSCIIICFCFVFSPVLIMSWSVVIVDMNSWCGFFSHTRQEELLRLSIHNQIWQESNIGRIMNHNISIQSKIVQELFVEEYNWFVVWSEWLRIFPPAKPPSKGLFTWSWGTPGRCCISLRWGNPTFHSISPFNLITFTC